MITTGTRAIQDGDSGQALQDASRKEALLELVATTINGFEGDMDMLEKAIGMLMLGDYLGWRVLVLVHSKSTLRRYEKILGIRIREMFPEEGPLARHSEGYSQALAMSKFWKVANGDIPVENRRMLRPQQPLAQRPLAESRNEPESNGGDQEGSDSPSH